MRISLLSLGDTCTCTQTHGHTLFLSTHLEWGVQEILVQPPFLECPEHSNSRRYNKIKSPEPAPPAQPQRTGSQQHRHEESWCVLFAKEEALHRLLVKVEGREA